MCTHTYMHILFSLSIFLKQQRRRRIFEEEINNDQRNLQEKWRERQRIFCQNGSITAKGWCPEIWDAIICWPSTPSGEMAVHSCPDYIVGFDTKGNATRQCMSNGEWYWSSETNSTWSNYTQCYTTQSVTVVMDIPGVHSNNVTLIKKYFPILKAISKVGYSVSLFTLIIAFCILAIIKKLRCPRNMLHMHTFASFMMRASMALLKDTLFIFGIGLSSDILTKDGENYLLHNESESNWNCKMFTSFWQYFILANYFWILMEGLYLHNLVFLALFADANSSIAIYVGLGWGLPMVFVISWIISRIIYENTFCWTTNQNPYLFLLIRIPTMLSILINFVLFVNIVRVLLSKLKCTVSEETQRYKRWARSTLVLVPLFGVHYTIFLGMSYSMGVDETVELVWLFCDQFFASFQGFFVAVLYCFMNREVRAEISRALRSNKWNHFRYDSRPTIPSGSVCSCNTSKFGRRGKRPKWLAKQWPCFYHDREAHRSTHSMASTQDIGTRGGSLASSRGYLDVIGNRSNVLSMDHHKCIMSHTTPLCSKCTNQSLLSFSSNMSEMSMNAEKIRERHRWSDSECCQLTYELHNLQHHTYH
ncbi:parathyroid hormone/parathyroid hormone-related peptide receptor-like isoform X3 [Vespa velutina]|uniref:parathyroid hormone/parathyroid hormone-related peptide receptor-like isoform X3 n=1 Tax=Vespa velutina TaxID=202808 RepID=UPI001FB2DF1A|nr:parathyroid hormone/parathyroid hormone-related peptide receptor-like isoform X3 [Vespa velutina]